MKKTDIKVHLTEEQTENNSGMINPQAVNDVRRSAGSGDGGSGSGDGGSGNWNSGPGNPMEATIHLSYTKENVLWNCSGCLTAYAYIIRLNSYARAIKLESANFSASINAASHTYIEGEYKITESGSSTVINEPLYIASLQSESGSDCVCNNASIPVKLYYSKTLQKINTTDCDNQSQELRLTISFTYTVSMDSDDNVSLSVSEASLK
jgi:hypothetical protein